MATIDFAGEGWQALALAMRNEPKAATAVKAVSTR
jgi:hypothetical protein